VRGVKGENARIAGALEIGRAGLLAKPGFRGYIAGMTPQTPPGQPFRKMHGAGNHFVVIDSRKGGARMTAELARAMGDAQRGIGFDQLAEFYTHDSADIGLDFWNNDGSRAGACGNATRCVALLMLDETGRAEITIATARGVLTAQREGAEIWVNMGAPLLDWADVPLSGPADLLALPIDGTPAAVGMGNPHCVFFVPDANAAPVASLGAEMEHHPLFPQRTNVEFASLLAPDHLRMRVWERGTGITLACGSGACATAVAAHLRGLTGRRVRLDVDGGTLWVDWREDGVWLSGPVAHVFDGVFAPDVLA
jgi:diaminopimelate epimerase